MIQFHLQSAALLPVIPDYRTAWKRSGHGFLTE